jgi:hypothetical protein
VTDGEGAVTDDEGADGVVLGTDGEDAGDGAGRLGVAAGWAGRGPDDGAPVVPPPEVAVPDAAVPEAAVPEGATPLDEPRLTPLATSSVAVPEALSAVVDAVVALLSVELTAHLRDAAPCDRTPSEPPSVADQPSAGLRLTCRCYPVTYRGVDL